MSTSPSTITDGRRYLSGPFAPVSEEVTAFDLPVLAGAIPESLSGRYLRNGPNPHHVDDPVNHHWFIGDGMVHGIRLHDGRAEWYRNRWVRSPKLSRALGEQPVDSPWPDDQVMSANTNVLEHAGRTLALVEAGSPPIELSYELETARVGNFDGTLQQAFTAHPKRHPVTGELHAVAYWWGWGNQVQYLIVDTDGRVRTATDIPLPGSPMMHDMALTERSAVLFDLPCTFDVDAAMGGEQFPYHWNPDYGARVGLLPIDGTGDVRWFEIEPCYVFHPMNAHELADGSVVVDVCRYSSVFDTDRNGPNDSTVTLDRWTINPTTGTVSEQRLDDRGHEFPRHDERLLGLPYRYGYTVGFKAGRGETAPEFGAAYKHDLQTGSVAVHDYGEGRSSGEAVFIPSTDEADEDDGWLMSLVSDAGTESSELVILHAQDVTGDPVCRIALPQRVPIGFHGNWVPDAS